MADTDHAAGFGPLESSKTALLTTFRRGGEAVGTPLSIAVAGDKAYFVTASDSGKAGRLAHTPRVTLAPCTLIGKVTGELANADGLQCRVMAAVEAGDLVATRDQAAT